MVGEHQGLASPAAPSSAPSLRSRLRPLRRTTLLQRIWADKRRRFGALAIVGILLVALIGGVTFAWNQRDGTPRDYIEVYITDLPANFSKLEVRLSGVYVGEPNHTLQLLTPRFDLLSLRGPADALKVAAGYIPAGEHHAVRIVFQGARAHLNGAWINLEMPDQMLTVRHDFASQDHPSSAFLFDIDVEGSVKVEGNQLIFRPHVDAVYHHSFKTGSMDQVATKGDLPDLEKPEFKDGKAPPSQGLDKPGETLKPAPTTSSFKSGSAAPSTSRSSLPTRTTSTSSTSTPTGSPTGTPGEGYLPEPGDVNSVPDDPAEIGGYFVRFNDTLRLVPDMIDAIEASWNGEIGAPPELVFTFATEAAAYVFATPEQAYRMALSPDIEYVEADQEVVLNLASSRTAIRLPQLLDPLLGLKDANGQPLDGAGIGVAVIDIGFDGTHPDLPHHTVNRLNPLMMANYKVESLFAVDAVHTDLTSGHGTHVLGILSGRGIGDPTQRGVAPGVDVYGFAIGEASTTLWPNTALDWLVQNHNRVDPPIRIVTNSWGSGNAYNPQSLTTRLVERLIDEGVTVVFSAGNSGGTGTYAATTSQCQIPKPGLICVAAYDDLNTGSRAGKIAPYSSRGRISEPATWPDISAPGTSIRSARPLLGSETGLGLLNSYTVLSGTSMAAPHVAGVAALMLQANPSLAPADVERILEQTALKYADGGAYTNGAHHAKGSGLLDAYAAVSTAKAS